MSLTCGGPSMLTDTLVRRLGEKIQQRRREQRAVGLQADGVAFGGQALAQAAQQPGERVEADQ